MKTKLALLCASLFVILSGFSANAKTITDSSGKTVVVPDQVNRIICSGPNFSIPQGEITVILGPNGVGKTTLLKCLNKILTPSMGRIHVKNKPLKAMDIRQIAKEISYVVQHNETGKITVFDAVLMGRYPHIRFTATREDLKNQTVFGAGKIEEIRSDLLTEVYGLPVEIIRHKGYPLVIPVEDASKAA